MVRGFFLGLSIMLFFVCSLVLLAGQGILQGIQDHLITDPVRIEALADEIADFTLPIGYSAEYAAEFLGFTLAAYKHSDSYSHIYLLQAPAGIRYDQAELEGYLSEGSSYNAQTRTRTLLTAQRLIRGQVATFHLSEGHNADGETYRQASAMFEGNQSTALLVISEPLARWDNTRIEAFIESVH